MPRIAGQGHEAVGGGQQEHPAWFQDTMNFLQKGHIILQVFNDLKCDHGVKLIGIDTSQRGKGGLHNAGLGWYVQVGYGVFVHAQVLIAVFGKEGHSVPFPAAQFKNGTLHIGYSR